LLRHAVAAFAEQPRVADVLVAIRPEDRELFDRAVAGLNVMAPVAGGPTRQDSVRLGLEALASCRPERVLIHDGARPFPDSALIDRVITGLDRAPRITINTEQLMRVATKQMTSEVGKRVMSDLVRGISRRPDSLRRVDSTLAVDSARNQEKSHPATADSTLPLRLERTRSAASSTCCPNPSARTTLPAEESRSISPTSATFPFRA